MADGGGGVKRSRGSRPHLLGQFLVDANSLVLMTKSSTFEGVFCRMTGHYVHEMRNSEIAKEQYYL